MADNDRTEQVDDRAQASQTEETAAQQTVRRMLANPRRIRRA
ncbi:hypothetical protein [Modestobacter sp. NPDC049651]